MSALAGQPSEMAASMRFAERIGENLREACHGFAARPAMRMGAEEWSYQELGAGVERFRDWLLAETTEGPILLVPRNEPSSVAMVFGAIDSGRAPLLADPAWTPVELAEVVRRSAARALVLRKGSAVPAGFVLRAENGGYQLLTAEAGAEPSAVALREDTAFGRFTSGTTGFPRCLQFSDAAALAAARGWAEAARLSPGDRVLCLATLNNGLCFNTSLLPVFLSGGLLAFHAGRVLPSSLEKSLIAVDATVFVAFPFAYDLLVKRPAGVPVGPALRLAVSSAAPLAGSIREGWRQATGRSICDYYGVAEVGPCTFNDGSVPDSVGRPLAGVSFTITDEAGLELPAGETGLIRIRTRSMASDYLDREGPPFAANLDEEGRYVSRDIGMLDATGHLVLKGRRGRMINVAGRKIDPVEVEAVVRQVPGVNDVFVCGDESPGRTILAAYVESESVTREQLVAFCVARLAAYKVPQDFVIVPRLPRSSTGKFSAPGIRALQQEGTTCLP